MNDEIKSSLQWEDEFRTLLKHVSTASRIVENREVTGRVDAFQVLGHELFVIEEKCRKLQYYFCRGYMEKGIGGQRLTQEDFYLLAAIGVLIIPSKSGTQEAYEEYDHYFYEDKGQMGYIEPKQHPEPKLHPDDPVYAKISFACLITPENVRTSFLREEQRKFFKEQQPELFARFISDS